MTSMNNVTNFVPNLAPDPIDSINPLDDCHDHQDVECNESNNMKYNNNTNQMQKVVRFNRSRLSSRKKQKTSNG